MAVNIVFRFHDVKVWDPAKFTENVSPLTNFSIVGHSSTFYLIFFVGVKLATRYKRYGLLITERFVKIFL
jgi:hypothetical protein